jgi:branched-chain amino acid:cation transporter, LIVCS family
MQKKSNEFIAVGLMLFALFFGAGNLIFPVFMGQNAGVNVIWAILGFLITGVGLPFLGVLAIAYSGKDLEDLASRVTPWYGVLFSVALYMTIGPCFAIPRTASVSFEIAIAPYLTPDAKAIGMYLFPLIFFIISWWLAITPSKLVSRIGKIITPLLLIFLAILIFTSMANPMGPWQAPTEHYATTTTAFVQGFLDGYNTMDALAALVFGVLVVQGVRMYGKTTNEEVAASCLRAGMLSTALMAFIYTTLALLGADSVSVIGIQENGAPVLVKSTMFYFGTAGSIILGAIVVLACLTTSVGLIASCAAYFNLLFPKVNHAMWATVFAFVSFGIALFGLSTIISAAVPVLMCLYPLTVALIILALTNKLFKGARPVYQGAIFLTLIPALYDGFHTAGLTTPAMDSIMSALPLASYGLGWVSFFVVGVFIGYLYNLQK